MDICILVRCYEYDHYTKDTIDSILKTATTNYTFIIHPNKASAAVNSNILLEMASSKYVILMDDDLQFTQKGWDAMLMETLMSNDDIGCVAPQLMDENGQQIGPEQILPDGNMFTGIEIWGALLAFVNIGIRYDEKYIKTICDDTDFLYQWISSGCKLALDTRVKVKHMRPCSHESKPSWYQHNRNYFRHKWEHGPNNSRPSWGTATVIG